MLKAKLLIGIQWKVLPHRITYVEYGSPSPNLSEVMAKVNFLLKVGQTPWSRSKGQSSCYQIKGLVTRIKYVKYESTSPNPLKVMVKACFLK